jgi:hypothetical protein
MANAAKLEAVLDHIRMNPKEHDQSQWAEKTPCGTTMCFAGHTVVREGYRLEWRMTPPREGTNPNTAAYCKEPDGRFELISVAATKILDLTYSQATALFSVAKTFDDVEKTVKDIINNNQTAA